MLLDRFADHAEGFLFPHSKNLEVRERLFVCCNVPRPPGNRGPVQVLQVDDRLCVRYHLTAFVGPELPDVLALAELTALGKPAVFIPLATAAGNEQAHNARHLEESGAAVALLGDVTGGRLREAVGPLLGDPGRREAMAAAARAHGRPDAAERLVDVILSAASR